MAILKKNELNALDANALSQKLEDLQKEIGREKGAIDTTGKPKNAGKYREMRKLKARIKTLLPKFSKK